jgi:hypothetical protein
MRWDATQGTARLQFPVDLTHGDDAAPLLHLMRTCQPASFGHNGEDVFDDTYRKATKLDRSAFSIDLCPYEVGIIDTIAQMLLPNSGSSANTSGIRAELYKLNVRHQDVHTVTTLTAYRSTLLLQVSLNHMSIRRVPPPSSARSSSAYLATIKEASLWCATPNTLILSTGG